MLAALACVTGSIDAPTPLLSAGDGHTPAQGVCGAPASLLPMLCDRFPALRQAPELIRRSGQLIGAAIGDIIPDLPAATGPQIDSILVKAAPRFL